MTHGTINVPNYYGQVKSIDWLLDLHIGSRIVNKRTGAIYQILSISVMIDKGIIRQKFYRIQKDGATITKDFTFRQISQWFWLIPEESEV